MNAVGRLSGKSLPPVRGRGFARGNPPLEFQAARPFAEETEAKQTAGIRAVAESMAEAWKNREQGPGQGCWPRSIPVMPEKFSFRELETGQMPRSCIPLGIRYGDLAPATVDLSENYCFMITGESGAGEYLRGLADWLGKRGEGNRLWFPGPVREDSPDRKSVV